MTVSGRKAESESSLVVTTVKKYENGIIKIKHNNQGETNMTKMIQRPLRKKLYMLTQGELADQIKRECKAEGVPVKSDSYGNIWSIRFQDKPIFVAHMDTVIGDNSRYGAPLLEKDGKLSRPGFVLGADDRAGVNLILNHKHKINFILTKDEEIGCLGAKALAKVPEFITDLEIGTFFIELDRKGNDNIIGHIHGYCEEAVVNAIKTVLPHYRDVWGVLTDIDAWDHLRQGVNLSVGYYNAHSSNEYLNIAEFDALDAKIEELGQIESAELRKTYEKPKRSYGGYGYGYNYSYYDRAYGYAQYDYMDYDSYPKRFENASTNVVKCDFCHSDEGTMYEYAGCIVCDACAVGIPEHELEEATIITKQSSNGKTELSDEELGKCSNCGCTVYPEEKYVTIPDWKVIFCEECYEEKTMSWDGE